MKRPTIAEVRSIIQAAHPGEGVQVRWTRRPVMVTYPTGLRGYRGEVELTAPGFRVTRKAVMSGLTDEGMWIR